MYSLPYIPKKKLDYEAFQRCLQKSTDLNFFSNNGPAKRDLEFKLSEILEIDATKSIICTSSGTTALHAILLFLKRRKNSFKFCSSSYTFPSCSVGIANASLVDIDFRNLSPLLADEQKNSYDGFLLTNLFGSLPQDFFDWVEYCNKYKKILILDNASSPLTKIRGKNICNYGDFSFGSLHHTKYLGFGEGGFAVIPREFYTEFEELLGFGFVKNTIKRAYNSYSSNYKMSDISAAAILQQILKFDFNAHLEVQAKYLELISSFSEIKPLNYQDGIVYGNFPIVFSDPVTIDPFRSNSIEAQKYYFPLADHQNSLYLFDRVINLPLHKGVLDFDLSKIIRSIESCLK